MRDFTLIESGYLVKELMPQQDKNEERYSVVPSRPLRHYYFNTTDSFSHFDIVLGDWGVSSWADKHLTEKIQPVALRAPEVLIEAPWDATTDFWNLGAVLLELFCAVRMFSGAVPPDGHYELKQHLTEVVDLFGPFPKALLEKGRQDIVQLVFNDEGMVKHAPPMNRPGLLSGAFMPGLDQEVKEDFASFYSR
jgi:serine/threonine-protein kinase SRPK3